MNQAVKLRSDPRDKNNQCIDKKNDNFPVCIWILVHFSYDDERLNLYAKQIIMNTLEKIGCVTRRLRTSRGLSQDQFCVQCGIDQHYISNIENGQRNLSIVLIEKIASFFNLSLSRFFAEVENIKDNQLSTSTPSQSNNSMKERFVVYMTNQGLSARTIEKYSNGTPNSLSVQQIIRSVTGRTDDMYHLNDIREIDSIIQKVLNSDFDRIGHSMYSAGLKKYKAFLLSQ